MTIKVGDSAPDFTLKDHLENLCHAADFKGKKVLLSFHPLAWTPVCRDQMLSLEANHDEFEKLNAVAVGISIDSVFSKKAWAESLGITRTRLVADFWPHGDVAQLYGIFWEAKGISQRANVIVDEKGDIAFVKIYDVPQLPDIEEILDFMKKM